MQSFHTICAHARLIMCWLGRESVYRPEFALLSVLVLLALVIMVSDGKMLLCNALCCRETERWHRLHKERVATKAASAHHLAFTLFYFALVITFDCLYVCVCECASGDFAGAVQMESCVLRRFSPQMAVVWIGSPYHL